MLVALAAQHGLQGERRPHGVEPIDVEAVNVNQDVVHGIHFRLHIGEHRLGTELGVLLRGFGLVAVNGFLIGLDGCRLGVLREIATQAIAVADTAILHLGLEES